MSSHAAAGGRREALIQQLLIGLFALAAFGLGWPAQAGTYYVDRLNPAASDTNPGGETLPWLTIQHAADTLVAGDTVLVKSGTYPEQVTVSSAGAVGQEIAFAAYPGHTVTVVVLWSVVVFFPASEIALAVMRRALGGIVRHADQGSAGLLWLVILSGVAAAIASQWTAGCVATGVRRKK